MAELAGFELPTERVVELAEAMRDAYEAMLSAHDVDGTMQEPVEEQSPETGATMVLPEPGSDQSDGPYDGIADNGVEEAADDAPRQSDGTAVIVDPETGETTTVDRDAVGRFDALVRDHEALLGLRQRYLDLYDRVAAGALSREDATRLLLDGIDAALPGTNESGSPLAANIRLRQALQRLATDIFEADDRTEAGKIFADTVVPPDEAEAIGELILSILPVTGELISARDAYAGFTAAIAAAREGETGEALREGGLATLATLGAIPLIGYLPRLGRGGVKAFRLVRQFLRRGRRRGGGETREVSGRIDDGNGSFGSADASVIGEEALAENIVNDPLSEPAFSWIHRGRHTTNRKLKNVWKIEENKNWPIDPETGRQQDVHHVIPLADAGPDHVPNIIPLTGKAHLDHHKQRGDLIRWRRRRR